MLDDFLDKFDELLPEMLTLTYQPDSGAAWVKAIKSFYFNNDLTTNKSEVGDPEKSIQCSGLTTHSDLTSS